MATATYDPTRIVLLLGGVPISGFAQGSMVKAEHNADAFKLTVGGDGSTVRSKSPDRSGKVTISLLQTSDSNATLSSLALLDETTSAGMTPLLIKDMNGSSLWVAAEAWVMKRPAGDFEEEAKDRTWTLECADLEFYEGGY